MLVCGGIQGQSDWGLIFQMFFFFFLIFYLFCSRQTPVKNKAAQPPLLIVYGGSVLSQGAFEVHVFPFFSSLAALYIFDLPEFVFTLQLCNRSHHKPILRGPWIPIRLYYIDRCISGIAVFFFTASAYGLFKSMNNFSFHVQAGFCHKFPSAVLFAWFFFFVALLKSIAKKIIT